MTNKFTYVFFVLWVAAIVSLSLVPLKVKFHLGTTGRWHNIGHLFMFLVATLLACRLTKSVYGKLLCCVGVAAIGFIMELVEKFAYRIPYEWSDVRVDCAGVLCGILVLLLLPEGLSSSVERTA
jgi:hypothetical protein